MRIREAINMVLWKYRDCLNEFLLVVEDRLTGLGYRYIPFTNILRVDNRYIYIGDSNTLTNLIPIHRVLRIVKRSGEIVWER